MVIGLKNRKLTASWRILALSLDEQGTFGEKSEGGKSIAR